LGILVYLVAELYPVSDKSPDAILAASHKALSDPRIVGIICIIFSHKTLKVSPDTDLTGGIGVERGIALAQGKKVGFLFDDWRDLESDRISSLLKPGTRELVFWAETPGDLEDLFVKFVNLALLLLEEEEEKEEKA